MQILQSILSFLWRCWFVMVAVLATFFIGLFLIYPFTFFDNKYPTAYFFLRLWAKVVFYGSGIRLKKHNFKEINAQHPYVIISNHTSMMDIMLMFILNKEPMIFVGKKELVKLPIFGMIYKKMNIIVDRKDPKSRSQVLRKALIQLKLGRSVCIFPEGGVPEESVFLKEFQEGPFAIAILGKVPLVTLTVGGLKEILPYAYFRGKPGTVHVYLNQITSTEDLNKNDIPILKQNSYQLLFNQLQEYYQEKSQKK